MIRHLLVVCVLGIGLYIAVEPIPENIETPWRLKLLTLVTKVIPHFAPLGDVLTPLVPVGVSTWLSDNVKATLRNAGGPNVTYVDTAFDGVPVRVFADEQTGEKAAARPAIVFYHGGGWSQGSIDMYHSVTALIARNSKAVVVSVAYRLAPEYVFPVAIDDCTAATVSFLQRLADFNVDPGRVAVMGDSAGGNLAAAVAQRLTFDPKYQNLPKLKLQVLIYPALQAFDFQTPSYQQNGDFLTIILDRVKMANYWVIYLGRQSSLKTPMSVNQHTSASAKASPLVEKCLSHDLIPDEYKNTNYEASSIDFGDEDIYDEIKGVLLNPDYAPLMREELRGLPEAYILTAEYDVLRDDGIMYAKRLEKAGVQVTWKHYKKGFHGMFSPSDGPFSSPSGDLSMADFFDFASNNL